MEISEWRMALAMAISLIVHGAWLDFGNRLLREKPPKPPLQAVLRLPTPPLPLQQPMPVTDILPSPVKHIVAGKRPAPSKTNKKTAAGPPPHTARSNKSAKSAQPAGKTAQHRTVPPAPKETAITLKSLALDAQALAASAQKLEGLRPYPEIAIRQGLQGEAQVLAVTNDNGQIIAASIVQSSGYRLLDEAATTAVRKLIHLPGARNSEILLRVPFHLR